MKITLLCAALVGIVISTSIVVAWGSSEEKGSPSGENFRVTVQGIEDKKGKKGEFVYGPGEYGRELKAGGRSRFYELHVPSSYDSSKPVPVVLVFHGGGGDPGTIRYESGMDRTSDREGFIVVYAAGTPTKWLFKKRLLTWNDGRPYQDGTPNTADDVGYVAALLDDLATLFRIDKKRVYACGYSNGGQFTYRLSKRMTDRIAAIATVAGQRPVKDDFDAPPSRPLSIMQFSGLQDPLAPYGGGPPKIGKPGIKANAYPVQKSIESWVAFDRCPSKPAETKRIGKAVMNRYGPCQDGTEVVLWTLEDSGHTWPGGRIVPQVKMLGLGEMGNVNQDINASDLMWEFFKEHPLEK